MVKMSILFTNVELHVGGHSTFVNRQIIRLIQFSCNCAFFEQGRVMQKVGCITTFLHSINATHGWNENGRF